MISMVPPLRRDPPCLVCFSCVLMLDLGRSHSANSGDPKDLRISGPGLHLNLMSGFQFGLGFGLQLGIIGGPLFA